MIYVIFPEVSRSQSTLNLNRISAVMLLIFRFLLFFFFKSTTSQFLRSQGKEERTLDGMAFPSAFKITVMVRNNTQVMKLFRFVYATEARFTLYSSSAEQGGRLSLGLGEPRFMVSDHLSASAQLSSHPVPAAAAACSRLTSRRSQGLPEGREGAATLSPTPPQLLLQPCPSWTSARPAAVRSIIWAGVQTLYLNLQ